MIWLTLALALLIGLAAVAYVIWPLVGEADDEPVAEDDPLTVLLARKEAVLQAIRDLEFDYRVGKIGEEDYIRFNQSLRRQAVAILQQMERYVPSAADTEDTLEAEIARRRKLAAQDATAVQAPPPPQPATATE